MKDNFWNVIDGDDKYVPIGCTFVSSKRQNDNIESITFATNWGVLNEYSIKDGSMRIENITFPDGYMINVDELLKG